ncbi:hypothetical protein LCGC14_1707700, partial [marine sediment metagenome]
NLNNINKIEIKETIKLTKNFLSFMKNMI